MRQGKVKVCSHCSKVRKSAWNLACFALTLLILKMCFSWGVNSAITIECLPPSFSFFVAIMKYANVVRQLPKITYMLNYIKSDYERLKGFPEYSVLYNCALGGRRFVLSFIDFIILLATIYFILPTVLIVNDIVTKNKSEDKYMAYQVEYYLFDAQKYYYFTVAHFYASSLMVLMFIITFDSLYIVFIQHACALFTVTGYRLKTAHILDANYLREKKSIEEYAIEEFSVDEHEKIHDRLVVCINEHRRALEFTSLVTSTYGKTFFFQVSFNIICLSITGVQLTLLRSGNVTEMIRLTIWMMGQLFHLFFVCLPGQKLMDFSEQVYFDAMDCKWYLLQQRSRALYRFLIINTLTPVTLTALKVTALNFQTFLSILKLFGTWGVDYSVAVECIPTVCTQVCAVAKYLNAVFQHEKVLRIMGNIREDNQRLMYNPEHKVLQRYAVEGRKYVISFLGVMFPLVAIYFTVSTALILSDYVSKNETEEKYTMYQVDFYFFDAQEHYGFTSIHCILASAVALVSLLCMDVMYITVIQHACVLYAVTGYRLKTVHILNMDILNNDEDIGKYKDEEISTWQQGQVYKRLVNCVREHKIAIEYTKLVQSAYSKTLFFQVSLCVLCLSISGVLILMKKSNPREVLRLGIWITGQLVHMFFLCLPGQRLMNFSEQVYFDALDCMWHLVHTRSRVIYQFIVMNTLTPITLTALKVTTLNMETFLSVLQTAMSYFTVVSSAF